MFEPKSKQENDAVSAIAKAKGMSRFWIGIHDIKNEGIFVYDSNDLPISYENWGPTAPSGTDGEDENFDIEDCVVIGYPLCDNYKWNDDKCSHENPFVCER